MHRTLVAEKAGDERQVMMAGVKSFFLLPILFQEWCYGVALCSFIYAGTRSSDIRNRVAKGVSHVHWGKLLTNQCNKCPTRGHTFMARISAKNSYLTINM